MSGVAQVSEQSFDAEVLKSSTPVLVDFYATWCGPCKILAPVLEEIAKDYQGKMKVVKMDIDEAQDTTAGLGITGVPTVILFKGGKEAFRRSGAAPKQSLTAEIDRVL